MLQINSLFSPKAVLLLFVACLGLWACALRGPAPALASHTQITFFEPEPNLLNPATRRSTFAQMKTLGVSALRIVLKWHEVAPDANSPHRPHFNAKSPFNYDWELYDPMVNEALRLKWRVLVTVSSPVPKWATAAHKDLITRPEYKAFEEFMTAAGLHYGTEVTVWGIWNEPNIAGWLMPQWNSNGTPASPHIYRGLYQSGYAGLKAAGLKSPKVLLGETSPFGYDSVNPRYEGRAAYTREMAPLKFLREALCLNSSYHMVKKCAKLPVYGYGQHPYTYPSLQSPFYRPPSFDEVTIGSLSRLSNALNLAARANAVPGHLPIYLTEFGVQSKPNEEGVSLSEQPEYDAISEKIAWEDPQVASFAQYLLHDESSKGRHFGYRTGLETHGGSRKAAYYGFSLPLVVTEHSGTFSLWGFVRPTRKATKVRVLVQTPGSRSYRTLTTVSANSHGYWTLHSSTRAEHWRVSWRSPEGVVYTGAPTGVS
ncbi:MAG: hypothetical protein ACRDK2_05845 [Solirubrobacteraceae bacterium]